MRHLLYAAVNGISASVLLAENQHLSAASALYNISPETALSINEKAAGLETYTTSCRPAANGCGADLQVCRTAYTPFGL
jgi:hypothetical protein